MVKYSKAIILFGHGDNLNKAECLNSDKIIKFRTLDLFCEGVKTTNEETMMTSVETGDTTATCEMLGLTIILTVLTLLFAFLWLVSIVLSQRVTVLKIKVRK